MRMERREQSSSTRRRHSDSLATTVRRPPKRSFLDRLVFWKNRTRPPETRYRIVVPNHLYWDGGGGGGVGVRSPSSATTTATVTEHNNDDDEDDDEVVEVVEPTNPNLLYATNYIRTTKYTVLSFLPKNLFEQFHRFANLYFLFIVLLNWVPQINAFGKEIAMVPVIFVLCVTAIKDLFEDRRRYQSDKRINNSNCRTFAREAGRYVKKLWKEVNVGDIVHLSCNEIIPADILLLHTSDEQGLCFIETANIDGESNLKQRQVVRGFAGRGNAFHPTLFRSTVECDEPNNKIYRFHGSIIHPSGEKVSISKENLLLRDCVLKNTDYVEGIVIYAGHETKAMLNNGGPRYKRSKLEKRMNWDVLCCVIILVVLCFVGATGSGLWMSSFNTNQQVPFLTFQGTAELSPIYEGFLAFWTHVIILQVLIPLSLYVSIEIIKLGQVFLIHNDAELYDAPTNKRLECRALNIPEELGQVQYIFSDKTGTLTENNMIFRRCTVGGIDYNHRTPSVSEWSDLHLAQHTLNENDIEEEGLARRESTFTLNDRLEKELIQMDTQLVVNENPGYAQLTVQGQRIQDFFLLMAVCNTVVVSKYPHQDKMNSSGLYLDASNNSSFNSEHDNRYLPLGLKNGRSHLSPLAASKSTSKHLQLPANSGRTGSPVPSPSGKLKPIYEAESPDELALVHAAYTYNCKLLKRLPESVTLSLPGEGLIEFQVLHVMPFDPVRKRMSIILHHPNTKEKILYCKGADSTMFPQLTHPRNEDAKEMMVKTQQHLNGYARKGLRILVMAKKVISGDEYDTWVEKHKDAEFAMDEREQRLLESACHIETNLELLGATGIEDRLQEGVPECIASLRHAGIVVWVLTGDKQETAVNIAYSCRLFTNDMDIVTLNARSKEAAEATIMFHLKEIEKDLATRPSTPSSVAAKLLGTPDLLEGRKRSLVIDGRTLAFVLEKSLDRTFLNLAEHCSAVLCCRATPLQKASIVKLVKDHLHVLTLAIGDGANDVSMIQTADVGIGISGQEGMQAVMASDFAMARFKYLERLLLVHGHWCYDRLARTILYFFYKNAGIIFIIFWYELYCGFSGMVVIEQLNVMLYNLIFTSLPPLVVGAFDRDAPADLLQSQPELYRQGRHSEIYKPHSFWVNMTDALYQSLVIFFIATFAYHDSEIGIWEFGMTITMACLVVQLFNLCIETKCWTVLHLASFVVSLFLFFAFNLIYSTVCLTCVGLPNPYWTIQHCIGTPLFWFIVLVISVLAPMPRFIFRVLQTTVCPSDVTRAVLAQKRRLKAAKVQVDRGECGAQVAWSRDTSDSVVSSPVSVCRIADQRRWLQQQQANNPLNNHRANAGCCDVNTALPVDNNSVTT